MCVRFEEDELDVLDKLANYLHFRGKIGSPTRSDVIRFAIDVLNRLVVEDIERRRSMRDE